MINGSKTKGQRKNILISTKYENITYQDIWDTAKAVQRGKFIPMNAYIKKKSERSQIT
jgi:hypothetical protein